MENLPTYPMPSYGAAADEIMRGYDLAIEAFGESAKARNSGLLALPYLFRRFGPPAEAGDDYKILCEYILTTADPQVWLTVSPRGSSLCYSVGYLADSSIRDEACKPWQEREESIQAWWLEKHPGIIERDGEKAASEAFGEWRLSDDFRDDLPGMNLPSMPDISAHWRDQGGVYQRVNQALYDALRELLRPVFVRDVPINILGVLTDSEADELGEPADRWTSPANC